MIDQRMKKDKLSSDQIQKLDKIGFVWDAWKDKWNENFQLLVQFQAREGHCRVKSKHKENGLNIGSWVETQRGNKHSLDLERIESLNSIGFSWNPLEEFWEKSFSKLEAFKAREGHCHVKRGHDAQDKQLAVWISNQRRMKDRLSPEKIQRLDKLGFVWIAPKGRRSK